MIGIVYYSKNGNSRIVAELLKEKYDGKIIELEEKHKRTGLFGFLKSGLQAVRKSKSELLGEPWNEISDFDTIYLCTPIWAGSLTPAMNTFIDKADLKGKDIIIVTVMADPKLKGVETPQQYLSGLAAQKGGNVIKCIALNGSSPFKPAEKTHIKRQFDTCL